MTLSIWTNIWTKIVEFGNDVKDFLLENSRNPVLWIGLVILGLAIFEFTYKALHKD